MGKRRREWELDGRMHGYIHDIVPSSELYPASKHLTKLCHLRFGLQEPQRHDGKET